MERHRLLRQVAGPMVALALAVWLPVSGAEPRFYSDDPIAREPDTQDASGVRPWKNLLAYDLIVNLFVKPAGQRAVRAMNVNTIDEVPDSNWFTNRVLPGPVSTAALLAGPVVHPGPAPGRWTLTSAKMSGISPGFVLRDAAGVRWFVQFDAPGHAEAASAASMIANRIFHALGYWQLEYHLATLRAEELDIDPAGTVETPSGDERPLGRDDVDRVLARSARAAGGGYRMLASRAAEGRILGGFRYYGTRPDDPNDVVPHEHRRELRALRVFGAWTNLVDMKAGNTLDVLVTEDGRARVRHYLQDVGSTFGTGALGPRDWDEGYEQIYEGRPMGKRLLSFGFFVSPWQTVPYTEYPSVGRFEGNVFDPRAWRPRAAPAAFHTSRADDEFWAARRVMAFSDAMIRQVVTVGQLTDKSAEAHLATVLMQRRDRIGQAYFTAVNPLVDFTLDAAGRLGFVNEAVRTGIEREQPPRYRSRWFRYDNTTDEAAPIGEAATREGEPGAITAPAPLPSGPGAFVKIEVRAEGARHPAWNTPLPVYFRRTADGWQLVGLERLGDR